MKHPTDTVPGNNFEIDQGPSEYKDDVLSVQDFPGHKKNILVNGRRYQSAACLMLHSDSVFHLSKYFCFRYDILSASEQHALWLLKKHNAPLVLLQMGHG